MRVRPATSKDLDGIMRMYDVGRNIMRENGNFSQWINGYPSRQMILGDIERGQCFVVCDDAEPAHASALRGVFMFTLDGDPTYSVIEDGAWLNDEPYGVIHRISSDGTSRGILRTAIDFALERTNNIRIDTHADNEIMQRALQKAGFSRCGIIYCHDGSPRIAFHLAV